MVTLNPIGRLGGGLADVPREAVRLALLGILCAALAGCATAPPRVATLLVGGSVVADGGGEVEVVRADAAAAAEVGFELQAGDVIRTGPRGQAVLSLEGGRVEVIVFENTEVHLSSIFVKFGTVVTRVLKKVKDKFEVESDYAVAGAESTEYLITVDPEGGYRCAVIEGRVQVRSPSGEWPSVSLARGEEATTGRPESRVDRRKLEPGEYSALVQLVNAFESAYRPLSARLVVPDLTGLPEAEARRTLVAYGLAVGGVSGRITRGASIGTVLDQSPAPGSRLQAGREVSLVVEAEPTTVPELSGMPVAEAERRLAAARLRTGEVRLEITGARPPGEVLRQRPEPQREVPVDSEVDLWVEAPSVVVPAFVGLDPQRVAALLRQAGLRARTDSRLVEGVADGVVLDQRPGAGARVAPGTMVALVVAERGVRVPNLVGSSRRVLERTLSGRELAIGRDASRPERASPGTIVEQSPAAGTLVRPGTPVHVTVATHCSVPDVRRMSREAALEALSRAKLNGRIGHVGEYRQNEVTGQEPRPGTTVECGSVVTISLGVDRGGYW